MNKNPESNPEERGFLERTKLFLSSAVFALAGAVVMGESLESLNSNSNIPEVVGYGGAAVGLGVLAIGACGAHKALFDSN